MVNEAGTKNSNQLLMVIAIAAGVVAIFAAGVLAVNYVKSVVVEPEREDNIASIKKIVADQPNNAQLIEHLQQKDLGFREGYFARQDMSKKAGYILLVSIVILVGAMKIGWPRQKTLPSDQGDLSAEQVESAASARRMVVVISIVLLAAAVASILSPKIDLEQAEPAGPEFATMEEVYQNWPSFRGPAGDGVSAFTNVPIKFDVESGENILWKSPVSIFGNSSPVVWGDKVFLTGGDENTRAVMCYDAVKGGLLWKSEVKVFGVPEEIDIMEDTGYAACTPVTDGQRVYAIFATGEIVAFDFEGEKVWSQNLGLPESAYGYASSLAIYEDIVIVQYDQGYEDDKSRLIGIKGATGQIAWETKRNVPNSWTSPIVAKIGDSFQIVTVADPFVIGYDPKDGSELWRVECVGGDVAPSPIVVGGLVYAIEPDSAIFAIKPVAKGVEGKAEVLWELDEGAGDIASPVCDGKRIYLLSGGYLTCVDIDTKEVVWDTDVGGMVLASPSVVGNMIYIMVEDGKMLVLQNGDEYKEVAVSELGEHCYASPAFTDGRIFIRGEKNIYCIGTSK